MSSFQMSAILTIILIKICYTPISTLKLGKVQVCYPLLALYNYYIMLQVYTSESCIAELVHY